MSLLKKEGFNDAYIHIVFDFSSNSRKLFLLLLNRSFRQKLQNSYHQVWTQNTPQLLLETELNCDIQFQWH